MTELVIVRAADDAALVGEVRRIVGFLDRLPSVRLVDVAYTCTFMEGDAVLSVVTDSISDLRTRLSSAADRIASGGLKRIRDKGGTYWFSSHLLGAGGGKLAFVFPGAMAYYPDMMRDLAILHSECRGAFDELEEALAKEVAFSPSNFIFPPADCYRHDADVFGSGAYAQALVSTYAGCVAMSRLLELDGIRPDGVVGFAGGDLAAMVRSGEIGEKATRNDRMQVIRDIYKLVDKAVEHGGLPEMSMITVVLRHPGEEKPILAALPKDSITLAIDFSPRQKTYAVMRASEAEAMEAFAAAGIHVLKLALNRPFNTVHCAKLVPAIRKFVDGWIKSEPKCQIYSCASASLVPDRVRKARSETAERWAMPVRFRETVEKMHDDGYRVFLEVGPRGLMTAAIDDTLKGRDYAAIALNSLHRRGVLQVQHAIAQLAALGGNVDIYRVFMNRGARKLDLDASFAPQSRREIERRLSRAFPKLTLLSLEGDASRVSAMMEPHGRGAKAAQRAAVKAAQDRSDRQFAAGAVNPLVSDADMLNKSPGVMIEIKKTFRVADAPFIGDFAIGNSQLSYSDPNLKGLILLSIPLAAEIMAETASILCPSAYLWSIENLTRNRDVAFENGSLTLVVRAERIASGHPGCMSVAVQIRDAGPDSVYTSPIVEAMFVMSGNVPESQPVEIEELSKPRSVHWSGRDIYPMRICFGHRLREIDFADLWSENGIDYEVTVPAQSGNVTYTQFPLWVVNPLLLGVVASGYALWRSHERFSVWRGSARMDDAYSFPFRFRRLSIHAPLPQEGAKVKCYLRLTGVTPKSLQCDITVSDGNGSTLMTISGWEERVEHVRSEYRSLIMQPAVSFITRPVNDAFLGEHAGIDVSSAFVTDIPYNVLTRNDEVWLKTFANIVLSESERDRYRGMSGTPARRAEWLFGRIAAKEAVRRFLQDYHQARWSYADVCIHSDDKGKPYAIGEWQDRLDANLDIAISHTSQFAIAVAAANAHVGVDIEAVERNLPEDFISGVFSPQEIEHAVGSINVPHVMVMFWCAKEAVSKALGTGIRYSPKELVIAGYDADSGRVKVRLEGSWLDAFREFRGRDIPVSVRTMSGQAVAFCLMPDSLFKHEG